MWCTEITGDGRKGEEAPEHVISLEAITVRLNMMAGHRRDGTSSLSAVVVRFRCLTTRE
jgi:hypothetical protein